MSAHKERPKGQTAVVHELVMLLLLMRGEVLHTLILVERCRCGVALSTPGDARTNQRCLMSGAFRLTSRCLLPARDFVAERSSAAQSKDRILLLLRCTRVSVL